MKRGGRRRRGGEPEPRRMYVRPRKPLKLLAMVDGELSPVEIHARCARSGDDDDDGGGGAGETATVPVSFGGGTGGHQPGLAPPVIFHPHPGGQLPLEKPQVTRVRASSKELFSEAAGGQVLKVSLTGGVHQLDDLQGVLNEARKHQLPVVFEAGAHGRLKR